MKSFKQVISEHHKDGVVHAKDGKAVVKISAKDFNDKSRFEKLIHSWVQSYTFAPRLALTKIAKRPGEINDNGEIYYLVDVNYTLNGKPFWEEVQFDVKGQKFSDAQLNSLKKEFGPIAKLDPEAESTKKLKAFVKALPHNILAQLSGANINFVSLMAKQELQKYN